MEVRGIGKGTAKAIRWAVNEAEENYREAELLVSEVLIVRYCFLLRMAMRGLETA